MLEKGEDSMSMGDRMIRSLTLAGLLLALPALTFGGDDPKDPKDPKNWTPVKIPGKQAMPKFTDIAEWINSDPLTVKDLKGKVVVVHFMAFG
jgi:hypothetical protein